MVGQALSLPLTGLEYHNRLFLASELGPSKSDDD